jgi:hypothetical protein
MDAQNEENLKELFERFPASEQAGSRAEDIREGEQLLREQPALQPREELMAEIKSRVRKALQRKKANSFERAAFKVAAAAAVVAIMVHIGARLSEKGGMDRIHTASLIPAAVWESENIVSDDADLATLTAEIEQLEGELLALQLDENGGNGNRELAELEMELVDIGSDFWKG